MRVASFTSVILPVLNAEGTIGQQLDGLAAQDFDGDWEVIVVDNGCTDGSMDIVSASARRFPKLVIVEARTHRGVTHARNAGAARAEGDLLAFCDADDVVTPGWLRRLSECAAASDLVGGALDDESLNDPTAVAWGARQQRSDLPIGLGFRPFALSCNLATWAEVFHKVGGWNPDYRRAGGDDAEFSWRAQLAGYRLSFCPEAVVRYRYRNDLGPLARQYYGYGAGGARLYRDFRANGLRRQWGSTIRQWLWVFARAYWLLGSRERRGAWVRRASYRFGRLSGSISNRVMFV